MMTKELRKLSRRELVDIIYQLKKNEQQMQEEMTALQEGLEDRRIRLSMAGSIAEAATGVTHLFSTAQTTAELYLSEIAAMKAETEQECARMIEEAEKKVRDIMKDGEKQFHNLNACYRAEYQKLQTLRAEIQRLESQRKYMNFVRTK